MFCFVGKDIFTVKVFLFTLSCAHKNNIDKKNKKKLYFSLENIAMQIFSSFCSFSLPILPPMVYLLCLLLLLSTPQLSVQKVELDWSALCTKVLSVAVTRASIHALTVKYWKVMGILNLVDQKPHSISLAFIPYFSWPSINLRPRLFAFFQLIFSDFTAYGLGHEQTGVQAYVVVSQRVEAEHQRLIRGGKIKE